MSQRSENTKIIAIAGPTAAGKTRVAVEICRRHGGEVVSADSMQLYRHMTIGTAAPTSEEAGDVPHHLVGVLDPSESVSTAWWLERATEAIGDISSRGKLPVVAGGTGLYFKALFEGLFEAPDPDPELRRSIKERAGKEDLYAELRRVDPEAADNIHPNDTYRITRALEVYHQTGVPISEHWRRQRPPMKLNALKIGLRLPRRELHRRINERARRMIDEGLVDEVKRLRDMGYTPDMWPMRHFGYRYIWACIRGEISLDEAIELLARDTRRYARRQLTWFRGDEEIRWFDPEKEWDDIMEAVTNHLGPPSGKKSEN